MTWAKKSGGMFPLENQLFVIAAITLIYLLFGCGQATVFISDSVETLQKTSTDDCSESFRVMVFFQGRTKNLNIDEHETQIENLSIEVFRNGLGIGSNPFHKKFNKRWHAKNAAINWTTNQLQSNFILPSGRVVFDKSSSDEVLFLFFDGEEIQLFKLDRSTMKFVATDRDKFAKLLKNYYVCAFDRDDVYWSYALVRCAEFFGFSPNDALRSSDNVNTETLFRYWTEIKGK